MRTLFAIALLGATRLPAAGVQTLPALPNNAVALAVQVDSSGNLYAAGSYGSGHAFVAKLTAGAAQTTWFTEFAGSKTEAATTLALGPSGSVYLAGTTQSTDFPTTQEAFDPTGPAGSAFAAQVDSNGNIVYSTYIPSNNCQAIAVDAAGHLLLTGIIAPGQTFTATPGAVMGAPLPSGIPTSRLTSWSSIPPAPRPTWPSSASEAFRSPSIPRGTSTPPAHFSARSLPPRRAPSSLRPPSTSASPARFTLPPLVLISTSPR
jgi:hypothetical protein